MFRIPADSNRVTHSQNTGTLCCAVTVFNSLNTLNTAPPRCRVGNWLAHFELKNLSKIIQFHKSHVAATLLGDVPLLGLATVVRVADKLLSPVETPVGSCRIAERRSTLAESSHGAGGGCTFTESGDSAIPSCLERTCRHWERRCRHMEEPYYCVCGRYTAGQWGCAYCNVTRANYG